MCVFTLFENLAASGVFGSLGILHGKHAFGYFDIPLRVFRPTFKTY